MINIRAHDSARSLRWYLGGFVKGFVQFLRWLCHQSEPESVVRKEKKEEEEEEKEEVNKTGEKSTCTTEMFSLQAQI